MNNIWTDYRSAQEARDILGAHITHALITGLRRSGTELIEDLYRRSQIDPELRVVDLMQEIEEYAYYSNLRDEIEAEVAALED